MTTCVFPSTVASPAPIASMAWFHTIRSTPSQTPARAARTRSRRSAAAAGARRSWMRTISTSAGTAYRLRKKAPVDGDTCASRNRIAENAIASAPAAASTATTGRWRRYAAACSSAHSSRAASTKASAAGER